MSDRVQLPHDFVPATEAELAMCLADPMWRICSGQLYQIMLKSDDGEEGGNVAPFKPNRAQRRLISRLWHRNLILKARQLGFTTLVAILWLDHALFNGNQRCGIIAQDLDTAKALFRDKVKFAYERLPTWLREQMPLARESADELLFANNSSIRVATSMRGGTIHRLHISEFGKIGAKYPEKAKEVITGSLPAVPLDGITVIESTAEGAEGEFHKLTMRALAQAEAGKQLNPRDYRLHFFAWWDEPTYTLDDDSVVLTPDDIEYFEMVEGLIGRELSQGQRCWYVATREADFSGDEERMWQEYPSFPPEAFQISQLGTYYAKQLTRVRKEKRIGVFPHVDGVPVNTFWDIGAGDGTAIWLHQRIGGEDRFIGFIEDWEQGYSHFITELQKLGYLWGTHYLPHDADHKRQQGARVVSAKEELEGMGLGGDWHVVPRVDDVTHGIRLTRKAFSTATFHEATCKKGLAHLAAYRKTWSERGNCWLGKPLHDEHSEGADAFRQYGQMYEELPKGFARVTKSKRPTNWRVA
ncbi:terminase [Comamonas serinivorans]|uniref:Terminase n=1 Tax=Comamonas serinivorans TaxID=1082851 RepID=A0A1Y0ES62_9BURK|nr:terminase [Comamonas serinivorans]ARU06149.1 terminase [Comamonas serinivorans]